MQTSLIPFDNNSLFDRQGHLTADGLSAMGQGRLDELGSLEAAEHLGFCNACLNRYTNWLESMPALLAPARDLTPQVQNLLRMRSIRVMTNRYVSMAAAVVLALGLWSFGAFSIDTGLAQKNADRLSQGPKFVVSQSIRQVVNGIGQTVEEVLDDLQAYVQSGFDQLSDLHPTNQQSGGSAAAKGE